MNKKVPHTERNVSVALLAEIALLYDTKNLTLPRCLEFYMLILLTT